MRRKALGGWIALGALLIGLQVGSTAPAPAQDETAESAAADADAPAASEAAEDESEPAEPEIPPLVRSATRLVTRLKAVQGEWEDLGERLKTAAPSDRLVIDRRIVELKLEYVEVMDELVENLHQQEEQGLEPGPARAFAEERAPDLTVSIIRHIVDSEKRVKRIRRERDDATIAAQLEVEQRLAREVSWLDALYRAYLDNVKHLGILGLDDTWARRDLSERLSERGRLQAARVELTLQQLQELAERAANYPDEAEVKAQQAALEVRRETLIASLDRLVDDMQALELDTAAYQQLLITATGEVTADIFERGVAIGLAEEWLDGARKWTRDRGPELLFKILLFFMILAIAWLVSRIARLGLILRLILRLTRTKPSKLLQDVVIPTIGNLILLAGLLIGLSQLGVHLGALLTGLGIAGFIVGFALQDSLSNFASGMMILGYRPFDVGDVIEAGGVHGTVANMSLVNTTILTFDNRTMIVPNSKIWGDVITNVTDQKIRRVDVEVRIPYGEDVDRVIGILSGLLEGDPRILADPAPNVRVHELGESAMRFIVRPWTKTEDYWAVYWDVTQAVEQRLDEEGIPIAVPRRNVVLQTEPGANA
jgi:small conductance mechanosensitive channel